MALVYCTGFCEHSTVSCLRIDLIIESYWVTNRQEVCTVRIHWGRSMIPAWLGQSGIMGDSGILLRMVWNLKLVVSRNFSQYF